MQDKILKNVSQIMLSSTIILSQNPIGQNVFAMDDNNEQIQIQSQHNPMLERLDITNNDYLCGISKIKLKNIARGKTELNWNEIKRAANDTVRTYGDLIYNTLYNNGEGISDCDRHYYGIMSVLNRTIKAYLKKPDYNGDGWFFDENNHVLIIDNDTAMQNFAYNNLPWIPFNYQVQKIIIKKNVTKICKNAFKNFNNLVDIKFENDSNLHTIEEWAFRGCVSLTCIKIPSNVDIIKDFAFVGCQNLKEVNLSNNNSIIKMPSNAFIGTALNDNKISELLSHNPTKGEGWSYDKNNSTLIIDNNVTMQNYKVDNFNVDTRPWAAFANQVRKIIIQNNVSTISECAFKNFSNLTDVEFTDKSNLHIISKWAFSNCTNLIHIKIPASVDVIKDHAFAGCLNLKEVNLSNNNSTIKMTDRAFIGTSLSENEISELLNHNSSNGNGWHYDKNNHTLIINSDIAMQNYKTDIFNIDTRPWAIFSNQIQKIIIKNKVTTIGERVFRNFNHLTDVEFENKSNLRIINERAFSNCINLIHVKIPESVAVIKDHAFAGCLNLKEVNLINNNSIIKMTDRAFIGTSLSESKIFELLDHNSTSGNGWSYNKDNHTLTIDGNTTMQNYKVNTFNSDIRPWAIFMNQIQKIIIKNNVTKIGKNAFKNLKNLTEIEFEETSHLHTIDERAFHLCVNLKSIKIPNSVTTIKNSAFYCCNNLEEIEFKKESNLKKISSSAFSGCLNLRPMLVPKGVIKTNKGAFINNNKFRRNSF